MGNEQSGNGQPTASEKSEGAVSTDDRAEDSADEKGGDEAATEAPESEAASTSESSTAGGDSGPPEGESPTPAPAPASGGVKPVILAIAAVVALIVGLVVGLAAGGAGSDDDAGADEAASEGDSEGHAGHEGHSEGMDMGIMGVDLEESGLGQLLDDHHWHGMPEEEIDPEDLQLLTAQLAPLDEYIEKYPTIADAEADGWRRAGPFIPGLGTHYIPRDQELTFTVRDSLDGDADEGAEIRPLLIYDGLEDDARLAGFMPMALNDEPADFAGPWDSWHHHTNVCVVIEEGEGGEEGDIDLPFVGDLETTTKERCEGVGGRLTDLTADMLHIWTVPGYSSELGMFSEINPKITCPDGTYHRVPYDELDPPYVTTCPGEQ